MQVVFHAPKNKENIKKHKISLAQAKYFDFLTAYLVVDDRLDYGEVRWRAIGFLAATLYALVFTEVADGIIRAISLRKAQTEEEKIYAEN